MTEVPAYIYNEQRTKLEVFVSELLIYPWSSIDVTTAEKELDALLDSHRARIAARMKRGPPYTWRNFALVFDEMSDERHKFLSPIDHLVNVKIPLDPVLREEVRKAYNRCLDKLAVFGTELMQDRKIYKAYKYLTDGRRRKRLTKEQDAACVAVLEGARLTGVELPAKKKRKFKRHLVALARLEQKFCENIQDGVAQWEKLVEHQRTLEGLPESAIVAAQDAAREKNRNGYLFSLGDATLMLVLESAKNRNLRREFYRAWTARGKRGGRIGEQHNAGVIEKELAIRHEIAHLLGHSNYAEVSLEYKMAESTAKVRRFLNDLSRAARPAALREFKRLAVYAKQHDGIDTLEPWDVNYYLERVKAEMRGITHGELRKYFPIDKVFGGMLEIANRLYDITFKERSDAVLWHPDAKLFEVYNAEGSLIAGMYVDLYERPGEKRNSAWMDTAICRMERADGTIQLPVGYLNCNFSPPSSIEPSLLTIYEVETLLHEFGHNLHLILTQIKEFEVSGLTGVLDDAIELPSQFMECFLWDREGLELLSGHYETGEKLPYNIYRKLRAAQTFGAGLAATWLVTRSLFDFRLHMEYAPGKNDFAQTLYREIRDDSRPIFFSECPWTPESFVHIFGGDGMEAGYFGYPWPKMLAANVFYAMTLTGKIDWGLGKQLEQKVLSRGASVLFSDCVVAFLGHKPATDALLRWYGFIK